MDDTPSSYTRRFRGGQLSVVKEQSLSGCVSEEHDTGCGDMTSSPAERVSDRKRLRETEDGRRKRKSELTVSILEDLCVFFLSVCYTQ